jgi:hypothetical protein
MDLKKITNYLSNIGLILFATIFVVSLIMYGNIHGFQHNQMIRIAMLTAFFFIITKWIYQFCYFKEYSMENIARIIFLAIIVILAIIKL